MSSYAIVRLEKVKSAESFDGRLSHNNRSFFSKNIDKTRTVQNIVITPSNYKNIDEFAETKRTQIREHNLKHGTKHRMLRKTIDKKTDKKEYKAMAQEIIISTSHKALTDEESIEYLKRADTFLREHFENCEVIQSVIHMDEKTPHLHFFVSYFDEKNCKFSQEELRAENKTDVDTIRDLFQEEVAGAFGLKKQDGSVVAPDEWTQANKEVADLKEELQSIKKEKDHFESVVTLKDIEIAELQEEINDLEDNHTTLKEKTLSRANIEQEIDDLQEFFGKNEEKPKNFFEWLKDKFVEMREYIFELEDENEILQKENSNLQNENSKLKAQTSKLNELDDELFQKDNISSNQNSRIRKNRN